MPLPETPHGVIPFVMRELLAAGAGMAAFFDRIAVVEESQLAGPIRIPSLLVVPGELAQVRVVGGQMECDQPVSILGVFPPETPWVPDLPAPAAPTLTPTGTSGWTGALRYRVTQANEWGESEASPESLVTVSAAGITVTRPTLDASATCWRVWASAVGRTALRWAATLPASVTSWLDDGTRRDDLAPIPFHAERWLDEAQAILIRNEVLLYGGTRYASAAMESQITGERRIPVRNLRVRELFVKVPTLVDAATKRILTELV